jgi:Family of unknown function (DUF6444)
VARRVRGSPGEEEPPPYEVLAALVASLRRELADRAGRLEGDRAELAGAQERIAELEARVRQTPRNSSRPPSSEGLDKPPPRRSLRNRSGRKPGGQNGHEGTTLAQVPRPDWEVRHEPGRCARQFCAIRSYLSTAAKHGLSFFDALLMLTENRPWIPAAASSNHKRFSAT